MELKEQMEKLVITMIRGNSSNETGRRWKITNADLRKIMDTLKEKLQQLQDTVHLPYSLTRMAQIWNTDNMKYWQAYGTTTTTTKLLLMNILVIYANEYSSAENVK